MKGAIARICAVVAVGLALSGCAAPIIGSLTLSPPSMIAGVGFPAPPGQGLAPAERVASGAPVSVIPASLIGFSLPIRFGIPRQGEAVGLSEVDGKLVYLIDRK